MMSAPRRLGILMLAAFPGVTAAAAEFAVEAAGLDKAIGPYRDASRISSFPVPVVMARRAGLSAGAAEAAEIRGQPPFGPLSFGVFLSWPLPCFSR